MERSLVIIKPDGVQRRLIGEIIGRLERKGIKIIGLKMLLIDRSLAEKHYDVHKGKQFYDMLVDFITSSPAVVISLEGENVVKIVRKIVGALNPDESDPGSIRGEFAFNKTYNVIHASDSPENGERETDIFFNINELLDYELAIEKWINP